MQLSMTSVDRRSPWVRGALTVSLCVSLAVVLGVVMPRGPMSTPDSVGALALCAGLGVLAGRLVGRWAVLLAPASFAMAFELVRLGADGPTVDRPVLGTIYAALALLVGRGFDGLVLLAPMVVGALWGAALRRRAGRPSAAAHATGVGVGVRRVLLGLATAAVLLLVVALVRPSSTLAGRRSPTEPRWPGASRSSSPFRSAGVEQSIMLRGARADAPVLLFLEGGPGGTAVGSMRASGEPLERSFVVATWDQRGTGRSAGALEDADSITARAVGRRHDRGHGVPAPALRPEAHLPRRQLVGHARWACSRHSADRICSPPTWAAVRWSTRPRPTDGCTPRAWRTRSASVTPASPRSSPRSDLRRTRTCSTIRSRCPPTPSGTSSTMVTTGRRGPATR